MHTLTITAKGQVTLRQSLLKHLGVKPGDPIEVEWPCGVGGGRRFCRRRDCV